jgi:uncharacterized metal-binding protein
MNNKNSNCAECPFKIDDKLCKNINGHFLPSCPTKEKDSLTQTSLKKYDKTNIHEFAKQSAIQEGEGYTPTKCNNKVKPSKSRIEEIVDFAKKMNYKKLGLCFCIGLMNEAKVVDKILKDNGFTVVSVICKTGRIPKENISIEEYQKVHPNKFEPMCNPIMQADILNEAKTDFNIMMGLCVGHDSLFLKHSTAMTTVFAVKDRLLGHNPLAAIYTNKSYYSFLNDSI